MMSKLRAKIDNKIEKGQSLVEVALFFPIFIIILAGLVEVSQLVITQNRVSNAVRVSSRFGANGGQDEGMVTVALNAVTLTLNLEEDFWDMWIVRGTVNDAGDDFIPETWEFNHAYGISNTGQITDVNQAEIQAEILADLQAGIPEDQWDDNVGGLRVVGMYSLHDIESILGLDILPFLTGFYSIRGFSYMRQSGDTVIQTDGCSAFPVGISHNVRSVTDVGSWSYPAEVDFTHPASPPSLLYFVSHQGDRPLNQAGEGEVFKVVLGYDEGTNHYGWLYWNNGISNGNNTLANSLTWPGNSNDFSDHGDPGTPVGPYPHVVRGYVNPDNQADSSLHEGDAVWSSSGSIAGVIAQVQEHIDRERTIRMIVWDEGDAGAGRYRIEQFAVFRIIGYGNTTGVGDWLLLEFMRLDNSCGQPIP